MSLQPPARPTDCGLASSHNHVNQFPKTKLIYTASPCTKVKGFTPVFLSSRVCVVALVASKSQVGIHVYVYLDF